MKFLPDMWKRFVVGEEIDLRVNYGFTAKRRFAESIKTQECNYNSIPIIEMAKDDGKEDTTKKGEALKRRILCCRYGKGTSVVNDEDVDPAIGKFKKMTDDELSELVTDPIFSARFFEISSHNTGCRAMSPLVTLIVGVAARGVQDCKYNARSYQNATDWVGRARMEIAEGRI